MSDWISVKDRLPEDRAWVLASCGGRVVMLTFYAEWHERGRVDPPWWGGLESYDGGPALPAPTHWMPLPEPPK